MANNDVPLQKQVFSLDLSKGIDESRRAELLTGTHAVQTLDNMVMYDVGGWVKRPGTTRMSSLTSYPNPLALIRSREGILAITNGFVASAFNTAIVHYSENLPNSVGFKSVGSDLRFPGFTSVANSVGSSTSTAGVYPIAAASSSKYDAAVYYNGLSNGGTSSGIVFSMYERDSGLEMVKIDVTTELATASATCKMVFVADRYLHVYCMTSGGRVDYAQVDTNAVFTSFTFTQILASGTPGNLVDCVAAADRSFLAVTQGTTGRIFSVTTALAVGDSGSIAHILYSIDYDQVSTVWAIFKDTATGRYRVQSKTWNNLSAAAGTDFVDATFSPPATRTVGIAFNSSTSELWIQDGTTATVGSLSVPSIRILKKASGGTSLSQNSIVYGWCMMGQPSYQYNGYVCAQWAKWDPVANICTNVVVNITRAQAVTWASAKFVYNVPVMSVLEPYNSVAVSAHVACELMVRSQANYSGAAAFSCFVGVKATARSGYIASHRITLGVPSRFLGATLGPNTYLTGGVLSSYDGNRCCEQGFLDKPILSAQDSGGAGNVTGAVSYVAVYKHIDNNGNTSYSQSYGPVSVTVTSKTVTVKVVGYAVGNKESGADSDQQVVIEVYRTIAGGTQFLLCATNSVSPTSPTQAMTAGSVGEFAVTDNLSDASLGAQPIMYRQQLQANGPLDRFFAPQGAALVQHKDRLFTTDAYGLRVYYSSFFVDGETAWFNPQFSFQVHGGSGRITGLASMDGRLVVFKNDAIFVVDGDGPPENGGTGTEFSPPQRIAAEIGCQDARSIVITSKGIMFRSNRGIELLTRSLQLAPLFGRNVNKTTTAYPVCHGSCIDSNGFVYFLLSAAESASTPGVSGGTVVVVYSTTDDAWSRATFSIAANSSVNGIATTNVLGTERVCLVTSPGQPVYLDTTTGLDADAGSGTYVASKFESGWLRVATPQGRQRIHDFIVLMKKASGNHKLTVSLAYDYIESYTQTVTWEPGVLNLLSVQELLVNPNKPSTVAIKIKIEDASPTDTGTYPVGAARGFELVDVSFEASAKTALNKLAASSKG